MQSDPLVYAVIGHAMRVHREIGPGVDEILYHKLLAQTLSAAGIEHQFKPRCMLTHRGIVADVFEPDLLLPGALIIELKALIGSFQPSHYLQLKTYLKCWQIRQGFLLDFGKESLISQSYVYDDIRPPTIDPCDLGRGAPPQADRALIKLLTGSIAEVCNACGYGYGDATYRGLLAAELTAQGICCLTSPHAEIRVHGRSLGASVLSRVLIIERCAVLLLSQRNGIRAADRAFLQTATRHLSLPLGLIVHFGKGDLSAQWVVPSIAPTPPQEWLIRGSKATRDLTVPLPDST